MSDSNATGKVATRTKPTLITLDNGRQITSTGRWNDDLLLSYLQEAEHLYQARIASAANADVAREKHGDGWISAGEIAKVAWGQNSIATKARARICISRLFRFALEHGVVISVDHDPSDHNRIVAVKVFDKASSRELELLNSKLDKLLGKKELSQDQYERAVSLATAA